MHRRGITQDVKGPGRLPALSGGSGEPTQSFLSAGILLGICSKQGKRPYQEDEASVRPFLTSSSTSSSKRSPSPASETHFFGLFDGHAGGRCSKFMATGVPEALAEDPSFQTNLSLALKRSYHTANEAFLKVADRLRYQDGSTGITVILRNGKLAVGNVGDCRAVLLSGGKAVQLSKDQKPTLPEEQKRLAALGATVIYCMGIPRVNGVLAVARAFGNRSLRSVIRPDAEITMRDLAKEDDWIVIGSDGLWDVLRNKDVCDICYASGIQGSQFLAEELVNTALARGSMDNVTCIVVRITGYASRSFEDASRGDKNASPSDAMLLAQSSGGGGACKLASLPSPLSSTSLRGSPLQVDEAFEEPELASLPPTRPGFLNASLGTLAGRFGAQRATPSPLSVTPTSLTPTPILGRTAGTLFRSLAPSSLQHHRLASLHSPVLIPTNLKTVVGRPQR